MHAVPASHVVDPLKPMPWQRGQRQPYMGRVQHAKVRTPPANTRQCESDGICTVGECSHWPQTATALAGTATTVASATSAARPFIFQ